MLSSDVQLHTLLQDRRDLSTVPLADIVANQWGTVERYCATVTSPILNNENGLMLTETWTLRLLPSASMQTLSRVLLGLQIAMLAVFCFALLRAGASVLMSAAVMQIGIAILLKIRMGLELGEYPFLACLVAFLIGVYVLGPRRGEGRAFWLFVAVAGAMTGYASNMRTSYLPMSLAMFVAWLAGVLLSDPGRVRRVRVAIAACLIFAGGYSAFHFAFVPRVASPIGSSYHPIAHPLVLSLAVPANPLATREGIKWNDSVGLGLARRVNPRVEDMRSGYETALFRYYFGLWSHYPLEMIDIYVQKWRIAGAGVVATAREGIWNWTMTKVVEALSLVTNGFVFLLLFVVTAAAAFAAYVRGRAPLLMGICLLAVAGTYLLAETAIIMPVYALMYHQSLLFVAGVLTLAAAQGLVSVFVGGVLLMMQPPETASANSSVESTRERTIADFGEQWTAYTDNAGFYGSSALLQDVFGPLLRVADIEGAVVADIGAGTGRFTNVFLASGAAKVVAVEPSRAFDVLTRNTSAHNGLVECVHVGAEHFKPTNPVDFVFSYGVLHHIPDPRPAVAAMHGAVKPGGRVGVWLYGREGNGAYVALLRLLTFVTRRLSHEALEACVWLLYIPTLAYLWLCRWLPLPLRHYFVEVFGKLPPDKRRLVLYDQLNPAYAKYYWQQEVRALLEDAGFVDVRLFHRHGYSWTAVAVKP
jgi:SAM-dependent methyltransferase